MKATVIIHRVIAATVLILVGCSSSDPSPVDGGGSDAPSAVTYTKDIQPILAVKCATCHTTDGLGNQNIGVRYEDTQLPATSFDFDVCWNDPANFEMPKKMGECALILVKSGRMPLGNGCGSPSPMDASKCLTPAEIAKVEAWVAGGMPK